MVLDFGVEASYTPHVRLGVTVSRALALKPWVADVRDGLFSQPFIRRTTQFESVAEFCEACPCAEDTIGGVQRLSTEERDAFVARTTSFETWAEMKHSAAVADHVRLATV